MQKTGIIVLGSVAAMLPALAQASETVRLAEPDLAMEGSLMTALKNPVTRLASTRRRT